MTITGIPHDSHFLGQNCAFDDVICTKIEAIVVFCRLTQLCQLSNLRPAASFSLIVEHQTLIEAVFDPCRLRRDSRGPQYQ